MSLLSEEDGRPVLNAMGYRETIDVCRNCRHHVNRNPSVIGEPDKVISVCRLNEAVGLRVSPNGCCEYFQSESQD
ncbi:MAG: hypothetical protein KDA91_19710 [Planctomycetaceae bacterium]|nr:hypothetical protein [Planctomycetaceae bacterium]